MFSVLMTACLIGSPGRARTADPVINSHLLYQLSYRGILISQDA